MNKLISFIKREPVLFAAVLLAVVSVVSIRPAPSLCIQAIDFRTLAIIGNLIRAGGQSEPVVIEPKLLAPQAPKMKIIQNYEEILHRL